MKTKLPLPYFSMNCSYLETQIVLYYTIMGWIPDLVAFETKNKIKQRM